MRLPVVSQPQQSVYKILHAFDELVLGERRTVFGALLEQLLPEGGELADLEEEVGFGDVAAVPPVLLKDVVLEDGQVLVAGSHFFEDPFLEFVLFLLIVEGDEAEDVLFVGEFLVEEFELGVVGVDGVRADVEALFELGLGGGGQGVAGEAVGYRLAH